MVAKKTQEGGGVRTKAPSTGGRGKRKLTGRTSKKKFCHNKGSGEKKETHVRRPKKKKKRVFCGGGER